MKKAALTVIIFTILSKFLGFGREIVQSYFYGASAITDAYLISQTIPSQIFSLISAGFATGFVPMYSRILKEEGQLGANRYTNNLTNALLLLASITVAFVLAFTEPVVTLFASGFSGETLELAVLFTRISVFGVFFSSITGIFANFLRIHNNFLIPALVGLPFNLITISVLFISAKTNVYVLIYGSVLATAFQLLLYLPFAHKVGYRYSPRLRFKDGNLRRIIELGLPVMFSRSVSRINVLVDRRLASAIAIGGISALNYADRIKGFVHSLFVDSLATVMYPTIAKMAAEDNIKGLSRTIGEAISVINLVVVPATIGAMVFSKEIVVLLFGRGAFTPEAISMTGISLFYYSVGMIAIGLRSVISRVFYAYQDTKTPTINSVIGVTLNIILNIILSKFMGIGGLALATSISAIVTALLMFITLRKKIGPFGLMEISRSFIKISVASLAMGAIAYASFRFALLRLTQNISLILAIGIGALSYAIIIYFMKIPEVESTLNALMKKYLTRKAKREDV